jgi:hypothetical protein
MTPETVIRRDPIPHRERTRVIAVHSGTQSAIHENVLKPTLDAFVQAMRRAE